MIKILLPILINFIQYFDSEFWFSMATVLALIEWHKSAKFGKNFIIFLIFIASITKTLQMVFNI